jgi:ferredoxin
MAVVVFKTDNITVEVPAGTHLMKVAQDNGAGINFACGDGRCGVCICKVTKGMDLLNSPDEVEQQTLDMIGADADQRLACKLTLEKEGEVELEY